MLRSKDRSGHQPASFPEKSDIRKSRMNGFEKYDKPRMNQLPGESYTLCDYKYFLKVPDNYHLEYDAHYYSVLYTYKGKSAILKATMTEIRICDEYNRLICRHPRSYRDFLFTLQMTIICLQNTCITKK